MGDPKLESKTIKQGIGIRLMEHGRWRLGLLRLLLGLIIFLGLSSFQGLRGSSNSGSSHWHVGDDQTAPPTQQFPVIHPVLLHLRWSSRWQRVQEFPAAYQVEGEKVATHPVVESSVAQDKVPFFPRMNLRCTLQGLQGLLAELLVENDQSRIVGEIGFGL